MFEVDLDLECVERRDLPGVLAMETYEECLRVAELAMNGQQQAELPAKIARVELGQANAWDEYVRLIPLTIRLAAGRFAVHQWAALEAMYHEPATREMFSRALDRRYALLCFGLADVESLAPRQRCELYRAVAFEARPHLVGRLLGRPISRADLSVLLKLPPERALAPLARRLMNAMGSSDLAACARGMREIRPVHLAAMESLPRTLVSAGLVASIRSEQQVRQLRDVLSELRLVRAGAKRRAAAARLRASARRTKAGACIDQVAQRWRNCITEAVDLPPAPFVATSLLEPLASLQAIRAAGRRLRNCLARFVDVEGIVRGDSYLFAWHGTEPAAVELVREGTDWVIAEARGEGDRELLERTLYSIAAELAQVLATARRGQGSGVRKP